MNRRNFLRGGAIAAGTVIAAPALLSLDGCNSSQIEGLVNTVLSSAENIIPIIEPNAPWLVGFQSAVTALQNAEQLWKNGGKIVVIEDALNTLAAVTAVIPITAPYSALIDVLIAGIESALAYFAPAAKALTIYNPHRGRTTLQKPHFLQTRVGAYKAQFNKTAVTIGHPEAQIK